MSANNVPASVFQGPIVDKNGQATPAFMRFLQDTMRRTYNSLTNEGQIAQTTPVQGRTEPLASTVKNIDSTGVVEGPGVDLSRPYSNKDFAYINGQVALDAQVKNQLASLHQANNAPTNRTNYCTVDSIDNGTDATIRVYDAVTGTPGTPWDSQVSSVIQGPYPALSQAGFAYATTYYVMYDPVANDFTVSQLFSDSLDDKLIFCGKLTTVASGGGGGTSGGGGTDGGAGGCTEIGTPLEFDAGNTVTLKVVPWDDWFDVQLHRGAGSMRRLSLARGTLVTVFKAVEDLQPGDFVEVENGAIEPVEIVTHSDRKSYKQVPKVKPAGTYRGNGVRLHNMKMAP